MADDNSLSGRVQRYAKVGTTIGGFAARTVGGQLFGLPLDRAEHAAELQQALGGLKGPVMKVAQILATVPDVLPEEYIVELAKLQTNAPAMGWAFVKRRMAGELGPNWQSKFKSFEQQAAAAAPQHQHVALVALNRQGQRPADLRRRLGALHRGRVDHHRNRRRPALEHLQHIADRRAAGGFPRPPRAPPPRADIWEDSASLGAPPTLAEDGDSGIC